MYTFTYEFREMVCQGDLAETLQKKFDSVFSIIEAENEDYIHSQGGYYNGYEENYKKGRTNGGQEGQDCGWRLKLQPQQR